MELRIKAKLKEGQSLSLRGMMGQVNLRTKNNKNTYSIQLDPRLKSRSKSTINISKKVNKKVNLTVPELHLFMFPGVNNSGKTKTIDISDNQKLNKNALARRVDFIEINSILELVNESQHIWFGQLAARQGEWEYILYDNYVQIGSTVIYIDDRDFSQSDAIVTNLRAGYNKKISGYIGDVVSVPLSLNNENQDFNLSYNYRSPIIND